MYQTLAKFGRVAVAILAASALAAGGVQAMGDSAESNAICDGPQVYGVCTANPQECQNTCDAIYGPGNSVASCWTGATCCSCLFP